MYIEETRSGYEGGKQVVRRARFLIMVQPESGCGWYATRALVRKVALRQLGHWMMGCARAFGQTLRLSGAYGNDGLPLTVPDSIYEKATPVPRNLLEAWNKGGGWNGCGSEAKAIREWAVNTFRCCPECGSRVVLREFSTIHQGVTETRRFWGCVRFPRCRRVTHIKD
jgi:hypothetical protein